MKGRQMIPFDIETVQTDTIVGIISRKEVKELLCTYTDFSDVVLISISEPECCGYVNEGLSDTDVKRFKDSLRVKFWDIEEDFGEYKVIPDVVAKQIQDFILKHKDQRFLIHCRAGQSRSAGVGLALECIKYFGIGDDAKYNYSTCFNSEIKQHSRYSPNLVVFDKIVKDYNEVV